MIQMEMRKSEILKLRIKINIWMCIISVVAIFIPPTIVMNLNIDSYEGFLCVFGNVVLMPWILFGITCIICIIYKFKKNIVKEIKRDIYVDSDLLYILYFAVLYVCIMHIYKNFRVYKQRNLV